MRLAFRVILAVLALVVVLGMGVHYDVAGDRHWPYPDSDDLAEEYDAHVGETTLLFGTVRGVDASNERAEIEVKHSDGVFIMTVKGFTAAVEPGGSVQVWGTLEPDRAITAGRVVVVNRSSGAAQLKYLLSGLGAVVVLATFFRRWSVNWETWAFEGR